MILSAIETVKIHFVSATNYFAILVAIEGNLKVELDAWILYLRYLVLLYPCNSFHQSAIFHLDLLIPWFASQALQTLLRTAVRRPIEFDMILYLKCIDSGACFFNTLVHPNLFLVEIVPLDVIFASDCPWQDIIFGVT